MLTPFKDDKPKFAFKVLTPVDFSYSCGNFLPLKSTVKPNLGSAIMRQKRDGCLSRR